MSVSRDDTDDGSISWIDTTEREGTVFFAALHEVVRILERVACMLFGIDEDVVDAASELRCLQDDARLDFG